MRATIRDGLPEIPGVKLAFYEDADEGGGSTYFAVNIFGQDATLLAKLGDEAKRRLETIGGVQGITTSYGKSRKEIQVKVDRDKRQSWA